MNASDPIGFFDSGWGGLSILKTARRMLPNENFIYVADCGYAPYGDRSHDFIVNRARTIASFLFDRMHAKALVVACNTATAEAIDTLRQERPHEIIVGIEPAIKPAVAISKNKRYLKLLCRFGKEAHILSEGCPGLMNCVEAGEFDSPKTQTLLHRFLDPMINDEIDTLVLGCTHYPFLSETIQSIVGPSVTIYEPSEAVCRHLKDRLQSANAINTQAQKGSEYFFVSGLNEQRKSVALRLWGKTTPFENLD